MRESHSVYVIELDQDVLYEPKFKKANPDYITGKPCVYVGMTGHDPDTRFLYVRSRLVNVLLVQTLKIFVHVEHACRIVSTFATKRPDTSQDLLLTFNHVDWLSRAFSDCSVDTNSPRL